MEIRTVPVSKIECWTRNPRRIKQEELNRLKKQIQDLGVYKPLVVVEEGDKFIALGGNMRLKAFKDLGLEEVEVSVVEAPDEATRLKFNLSDNDRAGEYIKKELEELIDQFKSEIDLDDFRVDLGEAKSLADILSETTAGREAEEKPEIEFSDELLLEHNYIVLYFDNPFDWEVAKEKFGLKRVRDLIPRKGQPTGVGRVVNGSQWLDRIHA